MKEQLIQSAIKKELTNNGWLVIKIIMASVSGVPDLMAMKDGKTVFIEVKNEIGKLSAIQEYRIKEIRNVGIEVIVARSKDDIAMLIYPIQK